MYLNNSCHLGEELGYICEKKLLWFLLVLTDIDLKHLLEVGEVDDFSLCLLPGCGSEQILRVDRFLLTFSAELMERCSLFSLPL